MPNQLSAVLLIDVFVPCMVIISCWGYSRPSKVVHWQAENVAEVQREFSTRISDKPVSTVRYIFRHYYSRYPSTGCVPEVHRRPAVSQ